MKVEASEFISARDASRALGKLIDRLENGEIHKAVILDRNKPRAIVLSLEVYEQLLGEIDATER